MATGEQSGQGGSTSSAAFPTTHWSVVLGSTGSDSAEADAALENLCRQYWYPLYAFVRRQGYTPADAEDIIQSFLAQVLQRDAFRQADPSRGRFRTFLLACLKHFMVKAWHYRRAVKRGGGMRVLSLEEVDAETLYSRESSHSLTPEQLYDRAWAWGILERARDRLREDYSRRRQAERFDLLEGFLPGSNSELSYADAGCLLGLREGSVKAEVHRLRKRYGALLRALVEPTVGHAEELDDELRALVAALSV
ncbi:MAG: RNA polymerase sigma factor [Verrucomicrobiia bacterium]